MYCCDKEHRMMSLVTMLHVDFLADDVELEYPGNNTNYSNPGPLMFWDTNYQYHPINVLKRRLAVDMDRRALRIKNSHLSHSLSN